VVVQFFVGTEVLLLLGVTAVCVTVVVLGAALVRRTGVTPAAHRLAVGLGTGAVTAAVLLAWPAWYALAGPAHVSGRVWPTLDLALEGTSLRAFVWPTPASAGYTLFTHRVGGYQGPTLSGQYVGLGVVAVVAVGLVVARRDRRLWGFAALAAGSAVLSLGERRSVWLPWRLVAGGPLLQNVIPSRFVLITYLSLAVALGLVADRAHRAVRDRRGADGPQTATRRWAPAAAGLAVVAVALVPVAAYLTPTVPMVTQPVRAPAWITTVSPHLAGHPVLLVFPVPEQVIESAMAWQAVTGFPYTMVGGGGPGGVVQRSGAERAGYAAIGRASFSFTRQVLRPGDVAASRRALAAWGVSGAVLPDGAGLAPYDRVTSVPYTVAFVTAVTGRGPTRRLGSWVWSGLAGGLPTGPGPSPAALAGCVALGASGSPAAVERVAGCVLALG